MGTVLTGIVEQRWAANEAWEQVAEIEFGKQYAFMGALSEAANVHDGWPEDLSFFAQYDDKRDIYDDKRDIYDDTQWCDLATFVALVTAGPIVYEHMPTEGTGKPFGGTVAATLAFMNALVADGREVRILFGRS